MLAEAIIDARHSVALAGKWQRRTDALLAAGEPSTAVDPHDYRQRGNRSLRDVKIEPLPLVAPLDVLQVAEGLRARRKFCLRSLRQGSRCENDYQGQTVQPEVSLHFGSPRSSIRSAVLDFPEISRDHTLIRLLRYSSRLVNPSPFWSPLRSFGSSGSRPWRRSHWSGIPSRSVSSRALALCSAGQPPTSS